MKNKRGWIKIIEAFMAVLFLVGVVLVVIGNENSDSDRGVFSTIQKKQILILREIQLSDSLRQDVLAVSPPVNWESPSFPSDVKNKIIERTPNSFECVSKICAVEDTCVLSSNEEGKNVYVESVIITVVEESSSYNPRQIKLFCWEE